MEEDNKNNHDHSNSSNISNQSGNVSPGLGFRIKGPTAPTTAAAIKIEQEPCYLCHICNQGFTSGQAQGGHMGIHSVSIKQDQKDTKDSSCIAKSNNVNGSSSKHICSLCGKTFPSNQSLCGHMRVHSQSVRKSGIESPLRWPVSPKRSPRFKESPSCLELNGFQEVDPLMQEAAYTLVLMSKGKF